MTINIIIVPVIAQWIGHPSLVHEVVSSPPDVGRKFFGELEHMSNKICVAISTQLLVLHEHKCVYFIYDKSVLFWRTQTCVWVVWPPQVFLECTGTVPQGAVLSMQFRGNNGQRFPCCGWKSLLQYRHTTL